MQTTLEHDELCALMGQCDIITTHEPCYLSVKQDEWLFEMIDWHRKQQYHKFTDYGVVFLLQVASGEYQTEWY